MAESPRQDAPVQPSGETAGKSSSERSAQAPRREAYLFDGWTFRPVQFETGDRSIAR